MKKNVNRLSETNLKVLVKKILEEDNQKLNSRYMFFSNLEQIHRQVTNLMQMDEIEIKNILDDGHDWAQDHLAEAKNNIDQVYDFILNQKN